MSNQPVRSRASLPCIKPRLSPAAYPWLVFSIAFVGAEQISRAVELRSPDGRLMAHVRVADSPASNQWLQYDLSWNGRSIIKDSGVGLQFDGLEPMTGMEITQVVHSSIDEPWTPVCGERSEIRDRFNQVDITLNSTQGLIRNFVVSVRAYDEGFAFRYSIPAQSTAASVTIAKEQSEFRFLADHQAWVVYTAQGEYTLARLSEVKPGCERPLTIQAADDLFLAVGEAGLVDFARMKLAPLEGVAHALVSHLDGAVESKLPLESPWRVIMLASSAGELLQSNSIFLNLNAPCALADTSWIKPGKVIREVTLTTLGGKACVDFAVEHGLQFVHFDAGWYGHEYDDAADAATVDVDPKRSQGPLDLHEVIAYAKAKDIGVILYVNRRALEKQLDEILPLYQAWGISGVKYGFVNVGSQRWTTWLHAAIRKAAEHKLMVDVHDEYRPTGFERTYPNLMTAEGIGGDETSPTNRKTLTILFSRLLCGPADNTVCYYDGRVDKNATHAYQLAKAVCIYSPWQYLYWYDRPASAPGRVAGAGGGQGQIGNEPELEFFDALPTVWDETRVIHGKIGEYVVIARRRGDEWFIGAMNSDVKRELPLPLDFLASDKVYEAKIYSDDPTLDTRTKVRIDSKPTDSSMTLPITMSANGGQAIHIAPVP